MENSGKSLSLLYTDLRINMTRESTLNPRFVIGEEPQETAQDVVSETTDVLSARKALYLPAEYFPDIWRAQQLMDYEL